VSVVSNGSNCNERKSQQRDTPPNAPDHSPGRADPRNTQLPTFVPQRSISEGEFIHFYNHLKPFEPGRKVSSHVTSKPMPERKKFGVLKGPFTTPPGGTDTAAVDGKPPSKFPKCEPAVTHVAGSGFVVHDIFSPSLLAGIATWDLEDLLKHTGTGPALRPELRATESRFRILQFEHAFRNSDASVLSDASPPTKLLPPYAPRIDDVTDENEPIPPWLLGNMLADGDGGGSAGGRGARGSRARTRNSQSGSLTPQRGLKRGNSGDDREDSKRSRKEQPPSDVPGLPGGLEDGILCPFRVRGREGCHRKSCTSSFKNLSKLKYISLLFKASLISLIRVFVQGTSPPGPFSPSAMSAPTMRFHCRR
jgi:hypothetical protein